MNWKEYKVLSEKTLSTEFYCTKEDELLLHAVMGILTEMEELLDNHSTESEGEIGDEVNRGEETADILWYLAILSRKYDLDYTFDLKIKSELNPLTICMEIIKKSLKMLDFLKKKLYYNKPINETLIVQLANDIMTLVKVYCSKYDINIEKSLDLNIEKLRARYGEKFSSERAINRDLVAEREILSK